VGLTDTLEIIQEKIFQAQKRGGLNHPVSIIAVTKTHPGKIIEKIYACGINQIGESRVQESAEKFSKLPELTNLKKHLIGHLQKNKVNKAIELFDSIDSVDSVGLAKKIENKAATQNTSIPVLLEINTSGEKAKFGFAPNDIEAMIRCCAMKHIYVKGLMTLGPRTREQKQTREAFATLRLVMDTLNAQIPKSVSLCTELSMGMSGDYEIAIEEGSTTVRLGTALFGPRREHWKESAG